MVPWMGGEMASAARVLSMHIWSGSIHPGVVVRSLTSTTWHHPLQLEKRFAVNQIMISRAHKDLQVMP